MTITVQKQISVMVVAPGPTFSTYDVFQYYLDAYRDSKAFNDVQAFNYHNALIYNKTAIEKHFPYFTPEDVAGVSSVRAARDLILDVIYNRPDVVFVVSGTLIPHEVYRELLAIRRELRRPFVLALYLTECPYVDDMQEMFVQYADVLLLNDKYSLKRFDPQGNHYVEYLPHSFNPKVHYPGNGEDGLLDDKYKSDIVFGGTAFKERVDLLASIDWGGVDLKLLGTWHEWANTDEGRKIKPYLTSSSVTVNNFELAEYYRGAKIALNIHRTREDVDGNGQELDNYLDAYSIGPRLYEASACGSFILTDYRKEAEDLFGDTIEFFDNADQLSEKIAYWLDPANEQERINRAEAARLRIQNCKFSDRIEQHILPVFNEVLKLRRNKDG